MTQSIIEHGLDIESIEALDFAFEQPCEYGTLGNADNVINPGTYTPCDRPAAWSILAVCGLNILFCQIHFDRQLEYISQHGDHLGRCPHCGNETLIKDYIVQATRL